MQLIKSLSLPLTVGIPMFLVIVLLWNGIERREQEFFEQDLTKHAAKIADTIKFDINKRIQSIHRMANRWQVRGGTPKSEFYMEATDYITHDIGYQALEWVDDSFHIRWVVPEKGNEAAINLNLAFEERRLQALERAKAKKSPTLSSPIQLVQGGTGLLLYYPLHIKNKFDGFILAVLKTENWLKNLLHNYNSTRDKHRFYLKVTLDDEPIYLDKGFAENSIAQTQYSEKVLMTHNLIISIQPTSLYQQTHHSWVSEIVLGGGIIFTLLLSVVIYLYKKATHAKIHAATNLHILEYEMKHRHEAEKKLAHQTQRLNQILLGTNVGTWEWNVQTGETIFNQRWAEIIGYDLKDLQPVSIDTWMKFAHPEDLERSGKQLEQHFSGELEFYDTEARMQHRDGYWVWVHDRGKVYSWTEDGKPEWMAGTHQEITARKEAEEQIHHLANHDALTGLPTLRLAQDRIDMAISSARREQKTVAVLFVDLDGFKAVNDGLGHDAGDALLKAVAKNLQQAVRDMDTVARIGGDEFLIVLTNLNNDQEAGTIAEKVIATISHLSETFSYQQSAVKIGASIGISTFPHNGSDIKQLIARADKAMYRIKATGKNHYCYFSDHLPSG